MPLKMEQLMILGALIVFIGFIVIFTGIFLSLFNGSKEVGSKAKVAVGGFIGPLPFGFGNDKNLILLAMILSIALSLFWLIFVFKIAK